MPPRIFAGRLPTASEFAQHDNGAAKNPAAAEESPRQKNRIQAIALPLKTYFVTGTDTGVGKTVLTVLLARFLRGRGIAAAAIKPVSSGRRGDARQLFRAMDGALPLDDINPWHFGAPLAPALAARLEGKKILLGDVLAHCRRMRKRFDALVVEGAGGLLSPLGEDFDSRDILTALRATPIIAAPNRLGTVNAVLLTLEALPQSLRRKAKIVTMQTEPQKRPTSAARSNPALLEQLCGAEVFTLPWLGRKIVYPSGRMGSRVRRTLQGILQ
ncbi:MAG: dethiobiotin synthase [Verrucomicrobiota bacterium]|nr:dethiobiotin synthase [Verrucomicrobiota bacterium]